MDRQTKEITCHGLHICTVMVLSIKSTVRGATEKFSTLSPLTFPLHHTSAIHSPAYKRDVCTQEVLPFTLFITLHFYLQTGNKHMHDGLLYSYTEGREGDP